MIYLCDWWKGVHDGPISFYEYWGGVGPKYEPVAYCDNHRPHTIRGKFKKITQEEYEALKMIQE